jgi:hypothetical protein
MSEETALKSLSDFVIRYIQEGRKDDVKSPLTLELSDIKIDTFSSYPMRTYLHVNPTMIEIYEHCLIDKLEKGWVWNGTMKIIESKKIGYFQVLQVIDPILENREYKTLSSEMDDLIEEIMNEISDVRTSLEKDIEDVKKLESDVNRHLFSCEKDFEVKDPILLDYDEKKLSLPSIDISYDRIEYPRQPTIETYVEDFSKKEVKSFEEKYLPFFDDEESKDFFDSELQKEIEEDDHMFRCGIIDRYTNSNGYSQRCRSNRRGSRCRVNYGMRKMRLRSY